MKFNSVKTKETPAHLPSKSCSEVPKRFLPFKNHSEVPKRFLQKKTKKFNVSDAKVSILIGQGDSS
jgi:hypothetical protein